MKPPLVSIVIVNYNYGRYIEECIDSIVNQTYKNIECIIVDNKSSDNSREIVYGCIESYENALCPIKFRCVWMKENLHLTLGCIAGFNESSGEFVSFLDADDVLHPSFVESHLFAHLSMRYPVGASSVDMYQSTENGVVATTTQGFSRYVASGKGRATNFTRELAPNDYKMLLGDGYLRSVNEPQLHFVAKEVSSEWVWSPTSGLCFRRDAVALMFRHKPNLLASVDAYLLRGISSLTGSVLIDAPLAVYRHHGANIFAKRPPLANFNSFAYAQLAAEDRQVADAIITCYRQNLSFLASSLSHHSNFINAVRIVASSGIEPLLSTEPSYVANLIRNNKSELETAFGADAVREWCKWFPIRSSKTRKLLRFLGVKEAF